MSITGTLCRVLPEATPEVKVDTVKVDTGPVDCQKVTTEVRVRKATPEQAKKWARSKKKRTHETNMVAIAKDFADLGLDVEDFTELKKITSLIQKLGRLRKREKFLIDTGIIEPVTMETKVRTVTAEQYALMTKILRES